MEKKVSVSRVAVIMGKSEQFVRRGLIAGKLFFATAVKELWTMAKHLHGRRLYKIYQQPLVIQDLDKAIQLKSD